MKPFEEQLNEVIVDTYRSILRVEENILKRSDQTDLSISEIHMLEAVGKGRTGAGLSLSLRRFSTSPCRQ